MEALVGSLLVVIIGQFSLLWYRLGKIEQQLKHLNNKPKGGNNG